VLESQAIIVGFGIDTCNNYTNLNFISGHKYGVLQTIITLENNEIIKQPKLYAKKMLCKIKGWIK